MNSKRNPSKAADAPPSSGTLRLSPATRRDRSVWRTMRADLYTGVEDAYNEFEMELILNSNDRACLIVHAPNNEAVGFIEVSLRNVVDGCLGVPVGYIEGIYLVPKWRGLGLGPAMIEAVAEWFRSEGCREMATDAEIENEDAQQFWSELGFEETWRIVQYRRPLGEPTGTPAKVRRASTSPTKAKTPAKRARKRATTKKRRR
jgi:aminoglycoside 6'-N-acetyltransferase I